MSDPVVLVEVLSSSTAERDDSVKRWAYGTIPSLKHHVLIAQNRAEAEVSTADGETWCSIILRDPGASLRLDALGLSIPVIEVFAGIDFTPEQREGNGD